MSDSFRHLFCLDGFSYHLSSEEEELKKENRKLYEQLTLIIFLQRQEVGRVEKQKPVN